MCEIVQEQPVALKKVQANFDYFRLTPGLSPKVPVIVKKKCSVCGVVKPLHFFRADRVGRWGRRANCIKCASVRGIDTFVCLNQMGAPRAGYKFCSKCKEEKPLNQFGKHARHSDGLSSICKSCIKKDNRDNYIERSDKKTHKFCNRCNVECPLMDFFVDGAARLHRTCIKCRIELRTSPKCCMDCGIVKSRDEFTEDEDTLDGLLPRCILCHRVWTLKRAKAKYNSDPVNRLVRSLRSRLWDALNRKPKIAHTLELVGCSGKELMDYIETLFWPGMTRDNQGKKGWAVDHIVPIESFDKSDRKWQIRCFHYTNLQPLWFEDNGVKQHRLDWTPAESVHGLPERLKHFALLQKKVVK